MKISYADLQINPPTKEADAVVTSRTRSLLQAAAIYLDGELKRLVEPGKLEAVRIEVNRYILAESMSALAEYGHVRVLTPPPAVDAPGAVGASPTH